MPFKLLISLTRETISFFLLASVFMFVREGLPWSFITMVIFISSQARSEDRLSLCYINSGVETVPCLLLSEGLTFLLFYFKFSD